MSDLRGRLADRVQLTTDGHISYPEALEAAFAGNVGANKQAVTGAPEEEAISTSHVERQNLTMRVSMRRFTRLTNGFSKRVENHCHMLALYFVHYNFCRRHGSLKGRTPAMAAGLTPRPFGIEGIVRMVNRRAPRPRARGPYREGRR